MFLWYGPACANWWSVLRMQEIRSPKPGQPTASLLRMDATAGPQRSANSADLSTISMPHMLPRYDWGELVLAVPGGV